LREIIVNNIFNRLTSQKLAI